MCNTSNWGLWYELHELHFKSVKSEFWWDETKRNKTAQVRGNKSWKLVLRNVKKCENLHPECVTNNQIILEVITSIGLCSVFGLWCKKSLLIFPFYFLLKYDLHIFFFQFIFSFIRSPGSVCEPHLSSLWLPEVQYSGCSPCFPVTSAERENRDCVYQSQKSCNSSYFIKSSCHTGKAILTLIYWLHWNPDKSSVDPKAKVHKLGFTVCELLQWLYFYINWTVNVRLSLPSWKLHKCDQKHMI